MERLIEANLESQSRSCRTFAAIDDLLAVEGRKPFAVVIDANGHELVEAKRLINSHPGWERVLVMSLRRREDGGPTHWPDFNFTGAAAVITPFDR